MRGEVVVLLHGLGRSPASLSLMARRLESHGWTTSRPRYPSTALTMDQAMERVAEPVARLAAAATRIHLAGHSLGGLLALLIARRRRPANLGRVVQIGSPNAGSEAAALAMRVPGVPDLMGPVLSQLDKEILSAAGPLDFELGCIAGDLPLVPVARLAGVRAPNDGLVTVSSAIHPAATDTVVLNSAHPLLPFDPRVSRQVHAFMKSGRFAAT